MFLMADGSYYRLFLFANVNANLWYWSPVGAEERAEERAEEWADEASEASRRMSPIGANKQTNINTNPTKK